MPLWRELPGQRGYDALQRMFYSHDLYVRVAGDTLVAAPPLIAALDDIAQIRERLATMLKELD